MEGCRDGGTEKSGRARRRRRVRPSERLRPRSEHPSRELDSCSHEEDRKQRSRPNAGATERSKRRQLGLGRAGRRRRHVIPLEYLAGTRGITYSASTRYTENRTSRKGSYTRKTNRRRVRKKRSRKGRRAGERQRWRWPRRSWPWSAVRSGSC